MADDLSIEALDRELARKRAKAAARDADLASRDRPLPFGTYVVAAVLLGMMAAPLLFAARG